MSGAGTRPGIIGDGFGFVAARADLQPNPSFVCVATGHWPVRLEL